MALSRATRFIVLIGVVSLFADTTYEGTRRRPFDGVWENPKQYDPPGAYGDTRDMMEGERIVDIVYGAEGRLGSLGLVKTYDLVFTDRRVVGAVVAKSGAARLAGQMLGGAVGNVIAGAVSKGGADKRRGMYAGVPLDNVVATDKANFSIELNRIERPQMKGLVSKYLHMRVDGKRAFFKIPKQHVDAVQRIITQNLPGKM